jgi:hypothetical protein
MTKDMLPSNESDGIRNLHGGVVTGVPGIGKSVFALYFIACFVKDKRFEDKRFAYEYKLLLLPAIVDAWQICVLQYNF